MKKVLQCEDQRLADEIPKFTKLTINALKLLSCKNSQEYFKNQIPLMV